MQTDQQTEIVSLNALLNRLAAFEPANEYPCVSVFLNAQADDRGRDNYQVWLKKELHEHERELGLDTPGGKSFHNDVERIMNYLPEIRHSANGVAIFACHGRDEFFETAEFDAPFQNNQVWLFDRPHVYPLARMMDQYPRYVVVQADTNMARMYTYGRDSLLDSAEIQSTKTKGHSQGGWSQARFERHIENFHVHHAKEVVEQLDRLVREENIDHVILSGDQTAIIPLLREQMPKALDEKVVAVLKQNQYAREQDLHEEAAEELRKYDAQQDREQVGRLMDATLSGGLGVTGVTETLAALSNGQVDELFILAQTSRIRYDEAGVEQVLQDYAPGDDNSTQDALPDTKEKRLVLDELIIRALNSAAKIRFIEDATLLRSQGGVGALLRYKIEQTA